MNVEGGRDDDKDIIMVQVRDTCICIKMYNCGDSISASRIKTTLAPCRLP